MYTTVAQGTPATPTGPDHALSVMFHSTAIGET
jgi:hypothetical protein